MNLALNRNRILAVVLLGLLVGGVALRLIDREVPHRTPDEIAYTQWSVVVRYEGTSAIEGLVQVYNKESFLRNFPPPTRFGYLNLVSKVMALTNDETERAGARVSLFFSILSLALLGWMSLRFFGPWTAFFSLIFLSVSPMDLALARRAWQDGVVGFFSALMIYVTCEIISNPDRRAWRWGFLVLGLTIMWVKTTLVAVYGLCLFWIIAVHYFRDGSLKKIHKLLGASVLVSFISFVTLCHVAGGFQPLFEAFGNHVDWLPYNEYAVKFEDGPWYAFVHGFFILSPVTTVFFFVSLITLGVRGFILKDGGSWIRGPKEILGGLILIIIVLHVLMTIPPYFKNLRLLSPIYVPFYLIVGSGLATLLRMIQDRFKGFLKVGAILMLLLVVGFSVQLDYRNYKDFLAETNIDDLSYGVLKLR
jgi:hypothetical protein